jgi:acetone carboxylase gamma subunit
MNTGNFKKGNIPWNKDKRGIHLSRDTEFKKGVNVLDKHPSWRGGIQVMKNDCVYVATTAGQRVRKPRMIYEQHHGAIPKGHVIWHIDLNRYNDVPENLEAISRAEMLKRNSNK